MKICPYCGEEFIAINGANKCNKKKCRKDHHTEYLDAYHREHSDFRKTCARCGKEFIASSRKQRYCSQSCASCGNPKLKALGEKRHKQRVEDCIYHISMCNTKGELKRRFPSDYNFCHKYRISEYIHLANEPNVAIKYSDEEILQVASLYKDKGKGSFQKEDRNRYAVARRRGLLGKIDFKPQQHLFGKINFVYRYLFQGQNAVYVGRTIKPLQRDYEHRRDRGKYSSSVFKFADSCACEIPQMEILASGLSGEESQILEHKFVSQYKEYGFLVLNKGATGLGTGAMGMKRQYSEDAFISIAHMYDSYSLFKKEHPRLFHAGERYGWLKNCTWLQHDVRLKNTITKEYCLKVARQYTSRGELVDVDPTVYEFIRRNGLWKLCPTIRKKYRERLSDAELLKIAKQYSCISELKRHDSSAAHELYSRGLITKCSWFMRPPPPVSHMRKVGQFTKEGAFVREYCSIVDALDAIGRSGRSASGHITQVCKGYRKTAFGFVWKYTDSSTKEANNGKRK